MTFWELVEGCTFYWQMFTLSKGRQIITDGRTDRKPVLMPSGQVYTRRLSVPADLSMYMVGEDTDTWTANFAGTTLTIRMLQEVKDEPAIVKFFCPECGKEMWSLIDWEANWDKARRYTWDALDILLECSDCILEEIRADRERETNESRAYTM